MAQSLCFTEGGNITPEDVERWPEELSNVLDTFQAGQKFRIYLELKELKIQAGTSGVLGKVQHIPA
jgi:hypothetical protein